MIFSNDRIAIRPWRPDEADRLFDMLSRAEVAQWLGSAPDIMTEIAEAKRRIERWADEHTTDARFGGWAVEERATGVPAGTVLLKPVPNGDGEVEIGWHLHPDRWGNGLATEAALALRDKGFREGLDEIYALTHLDNYPSHAVCRRIGMTHLGTVEKWYEGESALFRITREEWAA